MGVLKYIITVESDTPPQVMLGQNIGGGIVKELKEVDVELVPASQLAKNLQFKCDNSSRKISFNQPRYGR